MSRPLRRLVADGWYHVFSRGLERREIFAEDRDRLHFLELQAELSERYRIVIHAYALMDNHYHAIFQTPDANLSAGMQWLHGSYSTWFNIRHDRVGPLFQGRYRAVPVEGGRWAYDLSLYVHLNPVRISKLGLDHHGRVLEGRGLAACTPEQVAERLKKLRLYRWSSYRAYGGYEAAPPWLETKVLLRRASSNAKRCRRLYREAVCHLLIHGADVSKVEQFKDAAAIGSAEFGRRVRTWAAGKELQGISNSREVRRRVPVGEVRAMVEKLKGEPWETFVGRRGDKGLALFLWCARRVSGLTLHELGEAVGGMKIAAVSKAISRLERQAVEESNIRAMQQRLTKMSNVQP